METPHHHNQRLALCPITGEPHRFWRIPFARFEADLVELFGDTVKLACQDCNETVYAVRDADIDALPEAPTREEDSCAPTPPPV